MGKPSSWRTARWLPAGLVLAGPLPAQTIDTSFVAATDLVCEVAFQSMSERKTLAATSDLRQGWSLAVGYAGGAAKSRGTYAMTSTRLAVSIEESVIGWSPPVVVRVGRHQTLLTLRASAPVPATLRVTALSVGSQDLTAWTYAATVDIGADDKPEFRSRQAEMVVREFPVRIDSSGLSILTTTAGNAAQNVQFASLLTLELLPACRTLTYGRTCDREPPALTGEPWLSRTVAMSVSGAPSSAAGHLLLGLAPLEVPIPGTGCWLNTDVLILLPILTDGRGEASARLAVPSLPLVFNVQAVVVRSTSTGPTPVTTNGLRVVCP